MAKSSTTPERLQRQLERDIKRLEKEGQKMQKDNDQFEEKIDKLQDKIENLKDKEEISSEQEHQLKDQLGQIENAAKGKETGTSKAQLNGRIRDIDRELGSLEGTIKKEGEKSDPVENQLDEVEKEINELKKSGSDDKEVWKKIKRLEDRLDTIK